MKLTALAKLRSDWITIWNNQFCINTYPIHQQSSFRSCQIFFMSGRKLARKLLAHFRLRRGENLVEPACKFSVERDLWLLIWATVGRIVLNLEEWLTELEDTNPANEAEGQNTTSASRTKLLENGRDSETSTARDRVKHRCQGCRRYRPRNFLFLASWGRKCLENEEVSTRTT